MTTTTFYPDPGTGSTTVDGRLYNDCTGCTWDATRDTVNAQGTDPTSANTIITQGEVTGANRNISRCYFNFDTSSIPSGDDIDSATFSIYNQGSYDNSETTYPADMVLVEGYTASDNNLVVGDYDRTNFPNPTIELSDSRVTMASMVASYSYKDFVFNASGKSIINKTGITKLLIRPAPDFDNNVPTARSYMFGYYADNTGTVNDPKLVVTHSEAAAAFTPKAIVY